jgi:hypothetical protein
MTESNRTRAIALIGALSGGRWATETAGHPMDPAKMLPLADVLLLVDDDDGAMLFRYTAHGEFGGDTFHPSLGAAYEQAREEYGDALGEWIKVPEDIVDAHGFAVAYAHDRLNGRGGW